MQAAEILAKLEAWSLKEGDFHSDRQLADEVLLACDWRVTQDAEFAGGARWEDTKNPGYFTAETGRPNPLLVLGDAILCVPITCAWRITTNVRRESLAEVRGPSMVVHTGAHSYPSLALMIAVFSYKAGVSLLKLNAA